MMQSYSARLRRLAKTQLEANSPRATATLSAIAALDTFPQIVQALDIPPTRVRALANLNTKLELYVEAGGLLDKLVQKLTHVGPQIKTLLTRDVTDSEGMQSDLSELKDLISEEQRARSVRNFTYTRENTKPSELLQLAKDVLDKAGVKFKEMITDMPKAEKGPYFDAIVEIYATEVLEVMDDFLKAKFNENLKKETDSAKNKYLARVKKADAESAEPTKPNKKRTPIKDEEKGGEFERIAPDGCKASVKRHASEETYMKVWLNTWKKNLVTDPPEGTTETWRQEVERAANILWEALRTTTGEIEEKLMDGDYAQ